MNSRKNIKFGILTLLIALTGSFISTNSYGEKHPINHGLWNQVLKKFVTDDGQVDYMAIKQDLNFKKYLHIMSATPPQDSWTEQEKLTYWINAYNAFTVKLIIDNYPLKSIKDLSTSTKEVWKIKFAKIGNTTYSLNDIEHEILRKQFNEPRIHFAIVCASFSCPNLRNTSFQVDILDQQLDEQAKKFINDPTKNKISADKAEISQIFNWFKGDFTKEMKFKDFINKYSDTKISRKTKISYMKYDWSLNERK